jgi:hypothetical protein
LTWRTSNPFFLSAGDGLLRCARNDGQFVVGTNA